ncbi:MAG: GNAT family N-acetyltransferase [Oscillospiraceae bacterium]
MDNINIYSRKRPMTREHFARLFEIMEYSFPEDERRDFEEQFGEFSKPFFHSMCYEPDGIAGFMNYWDLGSFVYLEHFAVARELRGNGLGARLMDEFFSLIGGRPVILEAEPPELNETARRRVAFYERLGFSLNPHEYYQPPYKPGGRPVRLVIMSAPKALSEEEFFRARTVLYRDAYEVGEFYSPRL